MNIKIRGLRENNLNNLNLNLPTGQLTVICGPSGAGKTSLVLGTLFAESQRRFIETIGTRRRNKFSLWKRADLDSIENLPPAITVSDVVPDSETLASVSGLDDSIALEFSQKSIAKCPNCNTEIPFGTPDSIAAKLARNFNQQRGQIAFSPFSDELPFDKLPVLAVEYAGRGFSRWIFGSQTVDITDKSAFQTAMKTAQADSTYIVADRVLFKPSDTRLTDSLESAFTEGGGKAIVFIYSPDSNVSPVKIFVGLGYCCPHCGRILASPVTERFYLDELPPAPSALREDILAYQLNGKNLLDWYNLSAAQIDTALFPQTAAIQSVGLGYMPISRSVKSMSSGQIKRAALAAVLVGELVNMLYVFDEPTEGLPPENRPALLNALKQLVKRGNTVVIAENDPDFIAQADAVIELNQGNIVKATSKTALTSTSDIQSESISESISESSSESPELIENIPPTARRLNTAIANRLILSIPAVTPRSITIPTGQSTVICGPAGAGKTTLLIRGLYPAVLKKLNVSIPDFVTPVVCKLETYTDVSDCILLQQRSQRKPIKGCIATYLKLWDKIRDLLAKTAQSASHGFSAGDFSLHSGAGRSGRVG